MTEEKTNIICRIDSDLKKAFESVAKDLDLTVSQMLRRHIRYVVENHTHKTTTKPLSKPVEPTKPKTKPHGSPKAQKPPFDSKEGLLGMYKGKR